MKRTTIATLAKVALVAGLVAGPASADGTEVFSARLLGDSEGPPINSAGTATFHMEIGATITFTLTFSGLSSNPLVSHLHFAPTKVAGGAAEGTSRLVQPPHPEPSRARSRRPTLPAPQLKALPPEISPPPSRPCAKATPMPTCTPTTSKAVRFAAKSAAAIVARGGGWKGNAMRRFRGRRPPRPAIAENRESDPSLERREAS
jgi:CHRD domain